MPVCGTANGDAALPASLRLSKIKSTGNDELIYPASVNGDSIDAFIDSGASHVFMSPEAAKNCGLIVKDIDPIAVELADGGSARCTSVAKARIAMQGLITDE